MYNYFMILINCGEFSYTKYFIPKHTQILDYNKQKDNFIFNSTLAKLVRFLSITTLALFGFTSAKMKIFTFLGNMGSRINMYDIHWKVSIMFFSVLIYFMAHVLYKMNVEYISKYGNMINHYPIHNIAKKYTLMNHYKKDIKMIKKLVNSHLHFNKEHINNITNDIYEFMQKVHNNQPAFLVMSGEYGTGKTTLAKLVAQLVGGYEINLGQLSLLGTLGITLLDHMLETASTEQKIIVLNDGDIGMLSRTKLQELSSNDDDNHVILRTIVAKIMNASSLYKLPILVTMNLRKGLHIDDAIIRRITNYINIPSVSIEDQVIMMQKLMKFYSINLVNITIKELTQLHEKYMIGMSGRDIRSIINHMKYYKSSTSYKNTTIDIQTLEHVMSNYSKRKAYSKNETANKLYSYQNTLDNQYN